MSERTENFAIRIPTNRNINFPFDINLACVALNAVRKKLHPVLVHASEVNNLNQTTKSAKRISVSKAD